MRCNRRIWNLDLILDDDGDWIANCRECIIHMILAYEVGEVLGRVRPWSPMIESHIADFLQPSIREVHVRRRRFETVWLVTLSGPGFSNELRTMYRTYDETTNATPFHLRLTLLSLIIQYL